MPLTYSNGKWYCGGVVINDKDEMVINKYDSKPEINGKVGTILYESPVTVYWIVIKDQKYELSTEMHAALLKTLHSKK